MIQAIINDKEYQLALKYVRDYELFTIYPCSEKDGLSNYDAKCRIIQEGIGYPVQSYTDGKEFKDPKTRLLWKKASESLNELEKYLKDSEEC